MASHSILLSWYFQVCFPVNEVLLCWPLRKIGTFFRESSSIIFISASLINGRNLREKNLPRLLRVYTVFQREKRESKVLFPLENTGGDWLNFSNFINMTC